jgi:hypothetical protein
MTALVAKMPAKNVYKNAKLNILKLPTILSFKMPTTSFVK